MPSSFTPRLGLTLPATGENSGTWGTLVNTGITSLIDDSVAGNSAITIAGTDYTLTSTDGVTNEARRMFITATGTPGAARSVICPAVSKLYVIKNATTGGFALTLKTSAGAGISVPNGKTMVLMCNGTDVVETTTQLASSNVEFLQSGTGAVVRTAQAKMRDTVSVKDFGAVGDGVTDDSAAIQLAVNALSSGGTLMFPFATYKVNTSILISTSNINIVGNSSIIDATTLTYNASVRGSGAVFRLVSPSTTYSTTLASTAAVGATTLTLTSATNAQIGQLIRCISTEVQYRNTTATAYYNDQNKIVNIAGSVVTLESPLQYALTVSPATVTVNFTAPISNLTIDGFSMLGGGVRQNPLANGLGPCGVWGNYVENVTVKNCKIYGFQGIAVGIDGVRDFTVADCYFEGIGPNVVIVEGQNSSFYGAYAFRARRVIFTRCIGQRVRHIFDGSEVYQFVQSDSIASETHQAAFGSHEEVYDLDIVGNVSYGCDAGVVLRALTANISGNTFNGGSTNDVGITTSVMLYTDPGRARFTISGNRFNSFAPTNGAININACCDQLTISNNLFTVAFSGIAISNADGSYKNTVIVGNTFLFEGGTANSCAIRFTFSTGINGVFEGLLIANNTATGYTGNMISLYGSSSTATPADYFKITDNLGVAANTASAGIILRGTSYYGDNIVIRGNTQWGDTSVVVQVSETYRMRSYPVVELNDEFVKTSQGNRSVGYGASSTPAVLNDATLFRGSIINNTASAPSGPNYWVVTTVGTNGTITGVTGSITSGTNTLTLTGNDATKVYAGSIIGIAGSGLGRVRVDSIDATFTTATLASNAVTTVVGAAVTRTNPIISAGANLV